MDLNERLELEGLYETYGAMLSDKQSEIFKMYIYTNLSYGEIATELNISRPAVKDALDNAVNSLKMYESKLHFIAKWQNLKARLEDVVSNPTSIAVSNILEEL